MDHSVGKDLPSFSVESFENLPGRGLFATLSSIEVVSSPALYKCLLIYGMCIDFCSLIHPPSQLSGRVSQSGGSYIDRL